MVLIAKALCWNSRREEEMGRVKGRGRGRGERRERKKRKPVPLPPLLFSPSHLPWGLLFLLSPIFLCHKIKDGGFIVAIRLTSFRLSKIRLHCRLGFKVLKTVTIMKSLVVSVETHRQLYISMNPIQSKPVTLRHHSYVLEKRHYFLSV